MGVSELSRTKSKDYAIIIVYANKFHKVLDITTSTNVRCYEWWLIKRLQEAKDNYIPTNKALKFVKKHFADITDIKVTKLDDFYGNHTDAMQKMVEISCKLKIPTVHDYNTDAFVKQLQYDLNPPVIPDVEADVRKLNKIIEGDESNTKNTVCSEKTHFCELTNKYFSSKSGLAKHIKKSKEYQIALEESRKTLPN